MLNMEFPFVDIVSWPDTCSDNFIFNFCSQKQDRNLKTDKLNVLSYKIKSAASKVLEKSTEEITKPKLHHSDLAIIEDELKSECDVLNSLIKLVAKTKSNLEKISIENRELRSTIDSLKSEMTGKWRVNCLTH